MDSDAAHAEAVANGMATKAVRVRTFENDPLFVYIHHPHLANLDERLIGAMVPPGDQASYNNPIRFYNTYYLDSSGRVFPHYSIMVSKNEVLVVEVPTQSTWSIPFSDEVNADGRCKDIECGLCSNAFLDFDSNEWISEQP